MSKTKMPKKSVGGVYVHDMDKYLLEILKNKSVELEFLYAFKGLNGVCDTRDYNDFYNNVSEKINTVQYFIEKTKNKIKKNK